jgi:hypothetical protein
MVRLSFRCTSIVITKHTREDVREGVEVGRCRITKEQQQEMFDTLKETLARYKIDWIELRAIMVATGAVISGSTALAVLLRGEFVPRDLDIYVNARYLTAMLVFLSNHGYQVVTPQPHYAHKKKYPNSKTILTLKRDGEGEKIDLVGTTDAHVLATITRFHSTPVMNYIASYGIVCLYPEWTMRRNGLVTRRNVPYKILDKYRGRGFKIAYTSADLAKYDTNHDCGKHICCPRMRRNLRDGLSLFVPFDDRATDIQELEDNDNVNLQWMLNEAWECRKMVN